MSRSTQYIGITKDARDWLAENTDRTESFKLTEGMFDEEVTGYIYHLKDKHFNNSEYFAKEVVQAAPWSSGPMIFTCLELFIRKAADGELISLGNIFQWVANPGIVGEFNYEQGHYWV